MGEVDVMDQLLGSYRSTIGGKKWHWPLIINAINVFVVATWRLHCAVAETPKSHLEFRRGIAICLRKSPMDVRKKTTGGAIANLPSDLRYDSVDHFKVSTTQGRCKIYRKNTCYIFEKCNVHLYSDKGTMCFEMCHTRL